MNYSVGSNFFRNRLDLFDHNQQLTYLKTDIYEREDAYYLKMEVPGIEKDQLDIQYENGYLTISAHQSSQQEETEEYIRKERYYGEMQRTFYIGDIKEESIKANYENGILTVRLEKQEEGETPRKQITIE